MIECYRIIFTQRIATLFSTLTLTSTLLLGATNESPNKKVSVETWKECPLALIYLPIHNKMLNATKYKINITRLSNHN